jgi:biotin synthase
MGNLTMLEKREIVRLLKAENELQQELFQEANKVRSESSNNQVVIRGAVEISNCCQKRCNYCAMRRLNSKLDRFRLTHEEIVSIATRVKDLGISTLFLQSGQDPQVDEVVGEVLPVLRNELGLSVVLCLGERTKKKYNWFAQLGADGYIIKFETSDAELYKGLAHTDSRSRVRCIRWIKEVGMKVGTGNMVGLPNQTVESIADDILLGMELQPDFVSVSPLIPNEDTPLEHLPYGDLNLTLNTMALWRIALRDALMPTVSALEKIKPSGQLMGFHAGANVITVNFTPTEYRKKYPIYAKERFIVSLEHALNTVKQAGLKANVSLPPRNP